MEFGKQLAKYREKNNIDQKDIAKILNVKSQTISAYETGNNKIPYEKLIALCNHYKLNPLELLKADLNFDPDIRISEREQKILNAYRGLSNSDRRIVDYILTTSKKEIIKPIIKYDSIITDDVVYFPLIRQKASAGIGDPTHQLSNDLNEICFPLNKVPKGTTHTILIDGDSMEPIFFDGQIVFISAEKECNDGDYGIFQVTTDEKTDVFCKQLKYNEYGQRYLHSVNSRAGDPEFIEREGVILECIGKILI